MAALVTNTGKSLIADRIRTTPATYTTAPKYVAVGTGATAESVSQTALVTEVETRVAGTESTVTTTVTGDTYQSVGTVSATATRTLAETGLFDALAAGNLFARGLLTPTVGLNAGDSVQITWKVQLT